MKEFLHLSLSGTVFIAVIFLLRLVLKRCLPRTAFVLLWLAAAVRLLCPVRVPSMLSFWRLLERPAAVHATAPLLIRRTLSGSTALPVEAALPSVCDFLSKLWLCGVVLLLIGIAAFYLSGLRQIRSAQRLDNGIYLCSGLTSPLLCGIVRPRILLPENVEDTLLPYILLHERIHMRRLDNLWKLLALTAAAVHWFNPAAWLLVTLLSRDLEVSCDEWVLHSLDEEQRRSYALSLIAMAERPCGRSPVTCGFATNPLEERIRFIMTNRKKSMFALSVATAMIVCTTAAFATDAPVNIDSAPLGAADAAVRSDESSSVDTTKMGTYEIHSAAEADMNSEVLCTITRIDSDDDIVIGYNTDLEFFTAEEYEAYIEEQKAALLAEIGSGMLSQETYDMTIHDMEEVLAGIKAGTTMAAKPVTLTDGTTAEYVMATYDSENYTINYAVDEDGTLSIALDDQECVLIPKE